MSDSNKLKELEAKHQANKIKFKDIEVWPVLRYYICAKHTANSTSKTLDSAFVIKMFLNTFYGLKNIFKRCDYLFISSSDQRLKLEGEMVDKSIDYIAGKVQNPLLIERPHYSHYSHKKIPYKNITSKIPYYILTLILSKFIKVKGRIQYEKTIEDINRELNIKIDYKKIIKTYIAQYIISKKLQKWKKLKAVFVVCHYTNMGMIRAFKEQGVPVVEVQHGLIAKNHCAYNIFVENDQLNYPSYLLTFGSREKLTFSKENLFINPNNVIPVGHFYLDYINKEYKGDEDLKKVTSKYQTTVAVTSQNHPIEKKLIKFIKAVAELNPKILYIFIPRTYNKKIEDYNFPKNNVIMVDWLNVYKIIWHSDIHSTVFSTCALEAPSLGVGNILIDIDNYSTKMLSNILPSSLVHRYVKTPENFLIELENSIGISKIDVIEKNSVIIKPNYKENINDFINSFIHK